MRTILSLAEPHRAHHRSVHHVSPDDMDDEDADYFDPTRREGDPNLVVRELESGALGDFDVLDQVCSLGHRVLL